MANPLFEAAYGEAESFELRVIPYRCMRLKTLNDDWKFDSEIDPKKLQTASERVWFVNSQLEKKRCRSYMRDGTKTPAPCPHGIDLIESLPVGGLASNAVSDLRRLFRAERRNPTALATLRGRPSGRGTRDLEVLFLGRDSHIYLPESVDFLFLCGYTSLANFIVTHGKALASFLGGDVENVRTCLLTIVRYDPLRGLKTHIDGVDAVDQTFGPVVTVPMGPGAKCFDMFPTLLSGEAEPVRLRSFQFQPTIMQGSARMEYSHSFPYDQNAEHMTLIFRFRAFDNSNHRKFSCENPILKLCSETIELPRGHHAGKHEL